MTSFNQSLSNIYFNTTAIRAMKGKNNLPTFTGYWDKKRSLKNCYVFLLHYGWRHLPIMFSVNHLTNLPQSSVLGRTTSDQSLEGEKKACVCQLILLTFLIRNLKAKVIFRTMLFLFPLDPAPTFLSDAWSHYIQSGNVCASRCQNLKGNYEKFFFK